MARQLDGAAARSEGSSGRISSGSISSGVVTRREDGTSGRGHERAPGHSAFFHRPSPKSRVLTEIALISVWNIRRESKACRGRKRFVNRNNQSTDATLYQCVTLSSNSSICVLGDVFYEKVSILIGFYGVNVPF